MTAIELDASERTEHPLDVVERLADPDGGHGFPVMAFKAATVKGGGRVFGKAVKMTELRQVFTFLADGIGTDGTQLARIIGEPNMREDMVRVGMGTADIRFRAEYRDWSAVLP